MCGAEQTNSRLHPRSKVSRFGRPIVALSTHMSSQGCAHGSRVTRFGRPRAAARTHIVRAHVPCRIDETRVAPTDQGLPRFGRATADVSTHTHVRCRMYQFKVAPKSQKVTTEWQTNCCSEHTYVAE